MTLLRASVRRKLVRGPRTARLLAQHTLTGAEGVMYDSVSVDALPWESGAAYAGYVDGFYATWDELVDTFPGHNLLSITSAQNAARCIDVEPGDSVNSQIYGWITGPALKSELPVVYTMASNLAAVQQTMDANGFVQGKDWLAWSAHYIGWHQCGPGTCGYGIRGADATQYSTGNYDTSVTASYFFSSSPVPPPVPPKPAPVLDEEDDVFKLLPGSTQPWVSVSLDSANAVSTIGFASAVPTQIGVSYHNVNTSDWSAAVTVTVGGNGSAKTVLTVPSGTDAVTFERLDDVNIVLVPNFAS
jgi:hypothetical protein